MKKVESPDGNLKFRFCIEANEDYKRTSRSVYTNEAGEYYLVESEEHNIGSAYDHVNVYYLLEKSEADYFEKAASERERLEKEEELERERIELFLRAGSQKDLRGFLFRS